MERTCLSIASVVVRDSGEQRSLVVHEHRIGVNLDGPGNVILVVGLVLGNALPVGDGSVRAAIEDTILFIGRNGSDTASWCVRLCRLVEGLAYEDRDREIPWFLVSW